MTVDLAGLAMAGTHVIVLAAIGLGLGVGLALVIMRVRRLGARRPSGALGYVGLARMAGSGGGAWRSRALSALQAMRPDLDGADVPKKAGRGLRARTAEIERGDDRAAWLGRLHDRVADAVVWGEAGSTGVMAVRCVSRDADGFAAMALRETFSFGLTNAQAGEAIQLNGFVALVAAAAAPSEAGEAGAAYAQRVMEPLVERLQADIDDMPGEISGADRCRVRQAYAAAALRLSELQGGADWVSSALSAAQAAVSDGRRSASPAEWASGQAVLGCVASHSAMNGGSDALMIAVRAFRSALEDEEALRSTRATAHLRLALAEALIGQTGGGVALSDLDAAGAAADEALAYFQGANARPMVLRSLLARAHARAEAGTRAAGVSRLSDAADAYRTVLAQLSADHDRDAWSRAQHGLGWTLLRMGERERGEATLMLAVTAFGSALDVRSREDAPSDWAASQGGLGEALLCAGERGASVDRLSKAASALRQAVAGFDEAGADRPAADARRSLARAERLLAERRATFDR